MELYKRIKARREELGMSQEELATKLGYKSRSTINKIEMGKNDITQSKIKAFAQALNTTPAYLMGWEDNNSIDSNNEREDTIPIPIVGEVAAGMGRIADNHTIGYMNIPSSWLSSAEEHVLLKISGDSMEPEMHSGDLALIRYQSSVDSGSYAVALIDDENGVIKRVLYGKGWIELQSTNTMYAPRRFEGEDLSRIRIFGLVKKIIREYISN